jgi:hypothetical protein
LKRVVVSLGIVSGLVVAVILADRVPYWLEEARLIEVLKLQVPPIPPTTLSGLETENLQGVNEVITQRGEAARALGRIRSVRAIPYIIEMWGYEIGGRDSYEGQKALVLIGPPAIPYLRKILRGETPDPNRGKRRRAILTCIEMGPAALPLVPDLLEWRRTSDFFLPEAGAAIREITGKEPP